jgi:uncharacterized protein (TIGR02145 family)
MKRSLCISFVVPLINSIFLINSCTKPTPPVITTKPVTAISFSTATSGGEVTKEGGSPVFSKGVCWSTSVDPTIEDPKSTEGGGSGAFTSNIKWLLPNTTYYVRAYATNSIGTGYGDQQSFVTRQPIIPVLTTIAISSITETTAISGGNITSDNDGSITERGVCWDTKPDPTAVFRTVDGTGTGSFVSNITGLLPGNTYYAKAYATTIIGTTYGNEISFTTLPVSDADGNDYKTVAIGAQVWMTENLKTTKYNDGTAIPLVTNHTAWNNLTTDGYCWYSNDATTYKDTYGALYNWYVVQTGKICPTGWHVPTEGEWQTLATYLGGAGIAGRKLKETGTAHWGIYNVSATNETGFTALPGGYRFCDFYETFNDIGLAGYWWSSSYSTCISTSGAPCPPEGKFYYIGSAGSALYDSFRNIKFGKSVRCIWNKTL